MPAKSRHPTTYVQVENELLTTATMKIPDSRAFRDAWRYDADANVIVVNMAKARDLHRERLRQERARLLADLDWRQQSAIVMGKTDEAQGIEAQKQKLRDLTEHPKISKAKTPEALEKLTLDVLMGD